jgi:hypothetical protein
VAVEALREIRPQLFNLKASFNFHSGDANREDSTVRESGTHDESIGVVIDQRVVEVEDGEAVHDFLNAPQQTTNARLVIEKNTRRRRRCRSTPKNRKYY